MRAFLRRDGMFRLPGGAGHVGDVGREQGAAAHQVDRLAVEGLAGPAPQLGEVGVGLGRAGGGALVTGLGGIRPEHEAQLVALGQRRGVRVLGHRHRAAHGIQAHEVGVDGGRVGGHRPERRHVGHGEARGRRHLGHAPGGEVAQRRAARLQLGAQRPRPGLVVGVGAAVRRTDDEVALGPGGVLLQRAEQAADVGAALDPGQHVGDAVVEPVEHRGSGGVVLGRLAVDEVAHPLHRGAQRAQPRLLVRLRRVEPEPGPQRGGQRVGQPAGLGQRHGQRAGRHGGGAVTSSGCRGARRRVEPPPDQGRQPGQLGGADPPGVPGGHQQVVAVGDGLPQRHGEQQVAGVGRTCRPRRAPPRRWRRARPCGRRARCPAPRGSAGLPRRPAAGRAGRARWARWHRASWRSRARP